MSTKFTKEETLANEYANSIYPDISEYHEWKKIKNAYLAGVKGHRKMIDDHTKECIRCLD